jgi:hypothetical protein
LPSNIVDIYALEGQAIISVTHRRWRPYALISTGVALARQKRLDVDLDATTTAVSATIGGGLGISGMVGRLGVGIEGRIATFHSNGITGRRVAVPLALLLTF